MRRRTPDLRDFDPTKLIDDFHEVTEESFPDHWRKGSIDYELTYKFEPLKAQVRSVPVWKKISSSVRGFLYGLFKR